MHAESVVTPTHGADASDTPKDDNPGSMQVYRSIYSEGLFYVHLGYDTSHVSILTPEGNVLMSVFLDKSRKVVVEGR